MNEDIRKKIEDFFSKYKTQIYRKGGILVRAGDDPSGIFFLKKGRVREYLISKKGEEIVLNIFKPYAFFPMSFAVNKTPNPYFFEAIEDLELVRAPADDVVAFIKSEPDILFDLLRRVYIGTDGLLSRMAYLMSGSAYERLVAELLIVVKRFGLTTEKGFIVKITERDIASQVGMSRETVSRELKKLKDKKLIILNTREILVPSLEGLEDELLSS